MNSLQHVILRLGEVTERSDRLGSSNSTFAPEKRVVNQSGFLAALLMNHLFVIAREAPPTAAIQGDFQMDCFVAALLAMTDWERFIFNFHPTARRWFCVSE
jgi:hypothetical protein